MIDNTVMFITQNMNDIKGKSQENLGSQKKIEIQCIREENYLRELMLNSKSIQRMQDFINDLE